MLRVDTSEVSCVLLAGAGMDARLLLQRPSAQTFWTHFAAPVCHGEAPWGPVLEEIRSRTGLSPRLLYNAEYLEQYLDLERGAIYLTPAFVAPLEETPGGGRPQQRWCTLSEALELAPHPNQHGLYRHVWRYFVEREPHPVMRVAG